MSASIVTPLRPKPRLVSAVAAPAPVGSATPAVTAVTAVQRERRAALKGQQTRAAIVEAALRLATEIGLEGLSIGVLAEVMHMSKSGVFAHFGSREELQISVVREYYTRFEQEVFTPALQAPRGLPRLRALYSHWMQRVAVEIQSGCIFISGAVEFDDRPGPVRDALTHSVNTWLAAVHRAVRQAQDDGQLDGRVDAQQIVFEIHGFILALHFDAKFLKSPGSLARARKGFDHMLERYAMSPTAPTPTASPIPPEPASKLKRSLPRRTQK